MQIDNITNWRERESESEKKPKKTERLAQNNEATFLGLLILLVSLRRVCRHFTKIRSWPGGKKVAFSVPACLHKPKERERKNNRLHLARQCIETENERERERCLQFV